MYQRLLLKCGSLSWRTLRYTFLCILSLQILELLLWKEVQWKEQFIFRTKTPFFKNSIWTVILSFYLESLASEITKCMSQDKSAETKYFKYQEIKFQTARCSSSSSFFFIKKNVFLLKPIKNDINQAHTKGLEIRQNYTQMQNQSLKTVHLEKRKKMDFFCYPELFATIQDPLAMSKMRMFLAEISNSPALLLLARHSNLKPLVEPRQ